MFYGIAAVVRLLESGIEHDDATVDRAAVFMTLTREVRNGLCIVDEVEKMPQARQQRCGMSSLTPAAAELAFVAMELPPADLAQLTRLMVLVKAASRPAREQACGMLNAEPGPADHVELRSRHAAVIEYLERRDAEPGHAQ